VKARIAKRNVFGTGLVLLGLVVGCSKSDSGNNSSPPEAFTNARATRGGALYDKYWAVVSLDAPTTDHPLWASRPDTTSNERTGPDTWRCKECHGWDYKGVDGAYGSGGHRTGIAGIFGTTLSAQDAFDLIKTGHGYGDAGLSDDDIWDLAKFVLEGQIDTDDIIDGTSFSGSAEAGQSIYNTSCSACHGADGLAPPPGAGADYEEFIGAVSNQNPWEYQHKIRFGQPGAAMPAQADILTNDQVSDLGAFSQTLPSE
jgi:cytochrome c553